MLKKDDIEILSNNPSDKDLQFLEECINQIKPEGKDLKAWFPGHARRQICRIAADLEIVKKYIPKKSHFLEIGAIPLMLTLPMKKLGYSFDCVDLNPSRFMETINNFDIKVHKCDIEKEILPFDDNCYEFVILNEVFEHLRINPIFTISEIRRVLKPNGILLLSTPNLRSVEGLINLVFRNKGYALCGDIYTEYDKLKKHGHMGHVREYTTREIKEFLQNINFDVIKVIYRGKTQELVWFGDLLNKYVYSLRPFVTYIAKAV